MAPRAGSAAAKEFLLGHHSIDQYHDLLSQYDKVIESLDKTKKIPGKLRELDIFLHHEFVDTVASREDDKFIELGELSKIMQWKLLRGKFRPLQKLVDSNSPVTVISHSKNALKILHDDESNWEDAINELCQLKGIGVATATAVFATLSPHVIPFMADEVVEATCEARDYNMKVYKQMRSALVAERDRVNKEADKLPKVTLEDIGKVLWIVAMKDALKIDCESPLDSTEESSRKKRKTR